MPKFKTEVLWAQLDALYYAYIDPGNIPPGAFIPENNHNQEMSKLVKLEPDNIPRLPRHAKLRYDEARKKWIINAPERVFELDDTAAEIMKQVDGILSINVIVDNLHKKFNEATRDQISRRNINATITG